MLGYLTSLFCEMFVREMEAIFQKKPGRHPIDGNPTPDASKLTKDERQRHGWDICCIHHKRTNLDLTHCRVFEVLKRHPASQKRHLGKHVAQL